MGTVKTLYIARILAKQTIFDCLEGVEDACGKISDALDEDAAFLAYARLLANIEMLRLAGFDLATQDRPPSPTEEIPF
jgi:hypothetical protein